MRPLLRRLLGAFALAAALAGCAGVQPGADAPPRIAVMSAFEPELVLLRRKLQDAHTTRINGVEFHTGTLEGRPVVLFLSGISMTNATMNTQLALDRFKVSHIVFSGIAGGVNPALHIGDVVVPEQWAQYLEMLLAREPSPGRYTLPPGWESAGLANYGMIFPRPVGVRSANAPDKQTRLWFTVDPGMLQAARGLPQEVLGRCDRQGVCLQQVPRIIVGGNGVSGSAFVDNRAFREYTFSTFQASVLDMETAAVGHVAYANGVPFLAFRSLSDLAGGGEGENQMRTFFQIAADNSARVLLAFLARWKP